jgi:hypothetical protein
MTSTLIAGPGEEPVTLAEAKAFCRIDGDDEDALVGALVAAARLQVESLSGRALVTQTWRLSLSGFTARLVPLPVTPVQALVAAPEGATLQADAVMLAEPVDPLAVDYTAGYGDPADVPGDLKQAVLQLVAYWFEYRDSVAAPPASVERLIAGYRRVRL